MSQSASVLRSSLSVGLALLGLGCPTTYVTLGDDDANGGTTGGSAGVTGGRGGMGGTGGVGGVGGAAGIAGMVGGFGSYGGASGVGGVGGSAGGAGIFGLGGAGGAAGATGSCAPSEETLRSCAEYANTAKLYDYHGCLNQVGISMGQGTGGAPGALCEGYAPCSHQHEGCLYYQTSGAAGSNSGGCAGAPGDDAWLEDCGGLGYYGEEITGGTGGAGAGGSGGSAGGAGVGCDPAIDPACVGGAGGASGVGGVSGAGAGGEAGG
jgi:hypothetical protein